MGVIGIPGDFEEHRGDFKLPRPRNDTSAGQRGVNKGELVLAVEFLQRSAHLTGRMAQDNSALVEAAEQFLAAAKKFDGDPIARMRLTKHADNLRYQAEDGFGTIMRQWDQVILAQSLSEADSELRNSQVHLTAALHLATSLGILETIPREGTATSRQIAEAVSIH